MMLKSIAKHSAALLLDSQAHTQQRLESLWDTDSPLMEQQLEFLRHCLDSPDFSSAIDQILRFPHQRMERKHELRNISRAGKMDRAVVRQLTRGGGDRVVVPVDHPAYVAGLTSVPRQVEVSIGDDFRDTAENRFIKMVLVEFRDFLGNILVYLDKEEAAKQAKGEDAPKARLPLRRDCRRLSLKLDGILSHAFFQDLSRPTLLPLGSPVLQRKAGYREIYHFWLQFHASAQLSWEGGAEVWRVGARNVATLYEYWLFFELEALFREKFKCTEELHSLLVEKANGITRMKLKCGVEMGTPAEGVWSKKAGRQLSAHFHFDAKYRVTTLSGFEPPREGDDEAIQDQASSGDEKTGIHSTAAKYSDLLKMHAYRDAIRRTGGAYVLYPGNTSHEPFHSNFHEILPGLGAFSIRPAEGGKPQGIAALSGFLDKVIDHLSNRTTAHERSRYHLGESLSLKEDPVPYGARMLPETDQFDVTKSAVPPEEHKVLVVWSKDDNQLTQWEGHQIAHVRLGDRPGGLVVDLEVAAVRHLLVRRKKKILMNLLKLNSHDFTVHTGAEMLEKYKIKASEPDGIYAVFKVEEDLEILSGKPKSAKIWPLIEAKALQKNYRILNPRRSPDPVVLSLRSILDALAKNP